MNARKAMHKVQSRQRHSVTQGGHCLSVHVCNGRYKQMAQASWAMLDIEFAGFKKYTAYDSKILAKKEAIRKPGITSLYIIIECILTIYRHTAYQVVHLQIPAIEVYQLAIVKMNLKRNLAKLTFTLEAFHQGPLMKI